MVVLNSIHRVLAVPKELVSSGLITLEPVPGNRFEGEVPDHVARYLMELVRSPGEYVIKSVVVVDEPKAPAPVVDEPPPPVVVDEPAPAPAPAPAAEVTAAPAAPTPKSKSK